MGSSPSKGKLLKQHGVETEKAQPAEAPQDVDCRPPGEEDMGSTAKEKEEELLLLSEKHDSTENMRIQLDSNVTSAKNPENVTENEVDPTPQEIICDVSQTDELKKTESRKKSKGNKQSSEKQRKSSVAQCKMDFPPHMVRAHQAAYIFLNPNISKYETLLGLLDQAAQTQISLQPMISAVVLRFEEINQALEEMAEDGEQMLMEHGDYMALPSGMLGQAVRSTKPSINTANQSELPPDLLQQLLQHSAEKMRQVGGSVQTLGDTTLVEAVEYFSSLSKLLAQKLQAKQAAEHRLAEILAKVEGAAIRKSSSVDSTLHSEDSGFGGENESLTESEKQRRHSRSAGSGSCGSEVNIQDAFDNYSNNLANSMGHNEDDEEEDEDEEQDGEEESEDEDYCRPERKRSSSSPPDPSQALQYMQAHCLQEQQPTFKRPLTSAWSEGSSSTCSLNLMTEQQKSQKEPDPNHKTVSEIQRTHELKRHDQTLHRTRLRRQYFNGSSRTQVESNQPLLPSLPMLASQPPKRRSVRRLINTFSQGADGSPERSFYNVPPHIKRPNKNRVLLISNARNGNKGEFNSKDNTNSSSDSRGDLDVDNLPPPPLEVLMDNSFQSNNGQLQSEEELQEDSVQSLPVINQRNGIYQRRKITIQNVEILPNRATVRPGSRSSRSTTSVGPEAVTRVQHEKLQLEADVDKETEKANSLYQQARKIIHLCNAAESPDKTSYVQFSQSRMGQRFETKESCESDQSPSSLPVTVPPVSRVRLPPSCPSVRHRFPSPPAFKPQSTSRPSSRPSSPRTIISAADNTTEEIVPSVSFQDARSVFCRNEQQNDQTCLFFGCPVPPRQQGEVSRGRLSTRQANGSDRRTQSEQRFVGKSHTQPEASLGSRQARGREPAHNKGARRSSDNSKASSSSVSWKAGVVLTSPLSDNVY